MATFVKVGTKTKAVIRKKGFKTQAKTFLKTRDAHQWAKQVEASIERGSFDPLSKISQLTLKRILDDYLVLCRDRQLKAIRFVQAHSRIIARELGHLSLLEVDTDVLELYQRQRLRRVAPPTVKHELGIIRRALHRVSRQHPSYQIPHINLPKVDNARSRRIHQSKLFNLLNTINNKEVNALIELAIETGMRRGELLGITASNIDWKKRTLHVPKTKISRPRTVPLSSKAIEILRMFCEVKTDYLFAIKPDSVTQAFARACKKSGIQNLRFHDLRHEATSRFFEQGFSMMEVATITGHQDPRMLRRYPHLDASRLALRLN